MKILLTGYYGKANFGDDVLLKVTHGIVRHWRPNAEIAVFCDQYRDDYLPALLGEKLQIMRPGDREHFDLIVHGGGGTFFDFRSYGLVDRIIDKMIRIAGFGSYTAFDRYARKLFRKQRLSAEKRIGWGLGVGTYSVGSRKLRQNIPTLLDFDSLVVRDAVSIENLGIFGLGDCVTLGSDLAFLDNYWVPASAGQVKGKTEKRVRLGLILRDWQTGNSKNYLNSISKILPVLHQKYELSLFVFDKRVDEQLLKLAAPYRNHVWTPPVTEFDNFCTLLSRQDVIVSSRAHGALCGAIMSIPSVLIQIEPKLQTIHEMLPQTTSLLRPSELDLPRLMGAIDASLARDMAAIAIDVARNKELIRAAVSSMLESRD